MNDPWLVRVVAVVAVATLLSTILLFRRTRKTGRGAAIVCLIISVVLHGCLVIYLPRIIDFNSGGGPKSNDEPADGGETIAVAMFEPLPVETSDAVIDTEAPASPRRPLPVEPFVSDLSQKPVEKPVVAPEIVLPAPPTMSTPTQLAKFKSEAVTTELDDLLGEWASETLADTSKKEIAPEIEPIPSSAVNAAAPSSAATLPFASAAAQVDADFSARQGAAKRDALLQTGGDADTEASVAAALKFLVAGQRDDGAWDPIRSGAGLERAPLGLQRNNAGRNAETGLTGLALLSLLGAGHTHQTGEHRDAVYKGLVYLLTKQRPDGSLAGNAAIYEAHYCHAMATLALAETAAMTKDEAAMEATAQAIAYSQSIQHPTTGGWRYNRGDPGDLSQLGWHVMSIDAATRAGAIERPEGMIRGAQRFLDSVRSGRDGGWACYRPGERPTVTMTAEALAAHLMIGDRPSAESIREAETMILQNLPPRGSSVAIDNYYYWYYATIALHQLQDDAWRVWNETLKERLLATQLPDGSWPTTSLWGGYGGNVYTTSMATLCLESYYRHQIR